MNDSVKLFLVTCGSCKNRQVWDSSTNYRICNECDSAVVLRTASYEQLQQVKTQVQGQPLTFSQYLVYTLGPEDVDFAVTEKKRRQKQLKEDIAERKEYAESTKYAYPAITAKPKAKKASKAPKKSAAKASSKKKRK